VTVEDVTSQVSELELQPKATLMTKLIRKINSSILGLPINGWQKNRPGADCKGITMSVSSMRSDQPATKENSMKMCRRAQAATCKWLGLIQREEDFNEEVLQQCFALFVKLLEDNQVWRVSHFPL
jgi:hypothetical protein